MLLPYLLIIYYYLQDAIKLAEIFKIKPKNRNNMQYHRRDAETAEKYRKYYPI